ncbi:MAG TPA: hypothetical protein VMR88_02820 [Candidatus Polarisedimenticolaceae bacterium]|nr:hypothetical protein [Candidatus Polarisedimenticolaceae bacterium]
MFDLISAAIITLTFESKQLRLFLILAFLFSIRNARHCVKRHKAPSLTDSLLPVYPKPIYVLARTNNYRSERHASLDVEDETIF